MAVLLNTSLGDIVIDLHTDLCPRTCKNFLKLCKIKYYGNCLFHDVKRDFIAQTGDPTGKGTGGDSVYKYLYGDQARFFDDEFHPKLKHDKIGTVAMASAGENLNASQFYITLRDGLNYLDGEHTVFGEVAEGLETLLRINEAFVDDNGRPYKNIRIKHVDVLDDPFEDSPELEELIPDKSPDIRPPAEGEEVRLEDDWVPMDEKMDPEELDKSIRKKEAQSRAVVLEMIGDIPEAEVKPPENVLFICKLNPVTEEDDLETIFSRFGKIISADIIRDYKTGDSLCYGFIEFENNESCEAAYFKMDNVLIDDRRIHVDFSQSVSKLWTRFRKFGSKDTEESGRGHGQAVGGGCYNCGEFGHFKKDCPKVASGEGIQGTEALAKPKYTLKESTGQRGTSGNRYEMVFDGDEEFDRDADRSFERPSKRYRERTNHQRRTTSSEERLNDQRVSSVEGERRSHKHMYRREDADEYSRRRSGPSASSQGILDTDSRREGRSRDGRWDGQRGESPPSSRRNPESRRENSKTAEGSRENRRGNSSDLGETLTKAEFPTSARGRPDTKGGHFGKIDQGKKNHREEDSAFGRDKRSGRRSLSPQAHLHDDRRRHRKKQLESEDDKQTGALDRDMRNRRRSPPRQAHRHDDGRRRTDEQLKSEEDKQLGARSPSPVRKRGSITRRSPSRHMDDEDVPCRRSPPSVKERRREGRENQRGGRRERDSPDNSRRQRRSDEIDLPREQYGDERSHHDKRTRRNKRSSREDETERDSQKY